MENNIRLFQDPVGMAKALTHTFLELIDEANRAEQHLNVTVSGGNTPKLFFQVLAQKGQFVPWQNVHLFWVDERCVPPDDKDSNYGMTRENLLSRIQIPEKNIHRVHGEADPEAEAQRYGDEILKQVIKRSGKIPVFDWALLGIGEDGHTASLFPGQVKESDNNRICTVATHPVSGQKRISLTLPVINHAQRVTFLVSGEPKAEIISKIMGDPPQNPELPAAMVRPVHTIPGWFLDIPAASRIM